MATPIQRQNIERERERERERDVLLKDAVNVQD